MKLKLDPDDKNFPKVLSAKGAVMTAVLSATAKVNDGAFRKKNDDRIAELLEEVQRAETVRELMG